MVLRRFALIAAFVGFAALSAPAMAADTDVARGKYLVQFGGCTEILFEDAGVNLFAVGRKS